MLATVWQPQGPLKLPVGKGQATNWRSHVKIGKRNARTFFVHADLAGYPRPLRFELRPAVNVAGLRSVAPEAIAEYEKAISRAALGEHEIDEQLDVEDDDDRRDDRGNARQPSRRGEHSKLALVGGEHHQRNDRERQLQAEDHLRQDEQLGGAGVRRTRS